MSKTKTLAAIKALPGMTARFNADSGEYRVTFTDEVWLAYDPSRDAAHRRALSEDAAYYTDDEADALGTAIRMAGMGGLDGIAEENKALDIRWRDENYGGTFARSAFRNYAYLDDEAHPVFLAAVRRAGYEINHSRAAYISVNAAARERLIPELLAVGFTVTEGR